MEGGGKFFEVGGRGRLEKEMGGEKPPPGSVVHRPYIIFNFDLKAKVLIYSLIKNVRFKRKRRLFKRPRNFVIQNTSYWK